MADEPSWEDIFNPIPREPTPATAPPLQSPPVQMPPSQYPPTTAFPALIQPETARPVRAVESPFPWEQPAQQQPMALPVHDPTHGTAPTQGFPTSAAARFTPRDQDDPFAALFGGSAAATPIAAGTGGATMSRREARENEGRASAVESDGGRDSSGNGNGNGNGNGYGNGNGNGYGNGNGNGGGYGGDGGGGYGGGGYNLGYGQPRKKRRLLWLKITLPILIVLGLAGGAAAYAWLNYEVKVRELLGWELPIDYVGNGNGTEVIITIQSGDIGSDIASTLHSAGVTMTFDSFYDLLLAQKDEVAFLPGNYSLQKHMSAKSALTALLDPTSKVTDKLLITEGTTLPNALEIIAESSGIPLADLKAASLDLASFGLPAGAPSLEGYLFPATYQLDGGQSAHDLLQLLVTTMFEHLDSAGVPADQRHTVLTMAALIQREAGPNKDDFYKISRVFANRLEQGINLESDATVAYGTGNLHTVFTTDAERADANNPYNTYVHPGLPVGPIGLPGDLAIDAALHPVDGPWLFFVPINLQTGETVFSETVDEHDIASQKLQDWCAASPENDSYCQ